GGSAPAGNGSGRTGRRGCARGLGGSRRSGRSPGRSRRRSRSRLFLGEPLLVGLGGDAVGQLADLELGGAEQVGRLGSGEGAGDLQQLLLGSRGDGGGEFLGLGFLVSASRFLHGL